MKKASHPFFDLKSLHFSPVRLHYLLKEIYKLNVAFPSRKGKITHIYMKNTMCTFKVPGYAIPQCEYYACD